MPKLHCGGSGSSLSCPGRDRVFPEVDAGIDNLANRQSHDWMLGDGVQDRKVFLVYGSIGASAEVRDADDPEYPRRKSRGLEVGVGEVSNDVDDGFKR